MTVLVVDQTLVIVSFPQATVLVGILKPAVEIDHHLTVDIEDQRRAEFLAGAEVVLERCAHRREALIAFALHGRLGHLRLCLCLCLCGGRGLLMVGIIPHRRHPF